MATQTVEQYNKEFQTNNPQYFTPQVNSQVSPQQMASNRAQLVADSGGRLQDIGGKVVPITAKDLGQSLQPISVTSPTPATGYAGLSAASGQVGTSYAEEQARLQQEASLRNTQNDTATSKQSYLDKLLGRKTETGVTDTTYESGGVDTAKKELSDINQQLMNEQLSERRRIEDLEKTWQGSPTGKSEAIRSIQKESASKQADLAIVQLAKQNNYFGLKEIADRKIQAELEQDANETEALRIDYEDNKELFNKKEQRQYEEMLTKRDRDYAKKEAELKTLQDTKTSLLQSASQQEAPASVLLAIQNAQSPEQAITAAGKYGGDMLERQIKIAQRDNLYSQIAERNADKTIKVDTAGKVIVKPVDATKLNKELTSSDAYKAIRKGQDSLQFLTDFENLFNETGATSSVFSPRQNAELKAKYNATILNLKEFFNLGVLNGPDEAILKSIVPDPTNRSAFLTGITGGVYLPSTATKAGIENMKKQIEGTLDDRFKSISAQYGDYSPESLNSLKDLQRVYISQKSKINPNVAKLVTENPTLTYEDIISIISEQ